ncbi:hypothetical protein QPK87_35750 [Kamptonema cortianum]|nr:hypothetical protein [Oscillatoria laete-virens]MDK3161869.1 hypothetical protein [Kamptonema cortianum]MDL5055563.1 hypothetical protein [Oscillatoria laete-virens NRMC-F 0139]
MPDPRGMAVSAMGKNPEHGQDAQATNSLRAPVPLREATCA